MPPQNPYPIHQEGLWLETRHDFAGDIKIKDGQIWYVVDHINNLLSTVIKNEK